MPFNPKFTITPKINKALVEIERVRGFLDAELDFIINYDIKYRIGKELEGEDEE